MDGIPGFSGVLVAGARMDGAAGGGREAGAAELGSEQLLVLRVLKTEPKGSALGWMWWDRGVSSDGLGLNS